jgi:hypothetical protein
MRTIIPIILIIISVTAGFFYVKPLYASVMALRADALSYDTALKNSKDLQKTRDKLITAYKAISPVDKDRLNKFLPNTVNNIQLILEIQQIASKYGLSIKNISFKPPVEDVATIEETKTAKTTTGSSKTAKPKEVALFGTFDLDFKTQADYETFNLFIQDLEQNLRLIDIVAVDFMIPIPNKTGFVSDANLYDFSVKIKTYWLKH